MQNSYWEKRWETNDTGWDIGAISPPLKAYFDQLTDKNLRILVPGAGNSYEAEYLYNNGFKNVYVVEIARSAIASFRKRCPGFPADQVIHGDFFDLRASYDLIVEQTFFCAIDPSMRTDYVRQAAALLKTGGKLVGLLFDRFFEGGPPFGGSEEEYRQLFPGPFVIETMEKAYNSVAPRQGTELFIKLIRIEQGSGKLSA